MGSSRQRPAVAIVVAVALLLIACGAPEVAPTSTQVPATSTSTPAPVPTLAPTATLISTPVLAPPTELPVEGPVADQIGAQGGEIVGPGGARVIVPEGALSEQVQIRIAEAPATLEIPAALEASPAGPFYEVKVSEGTELQDMVDLVLPLQRQAGADESRYTVLRWDESTWSDVGGFVEGDFVRVPVNQFSIYCPVYGPLALRPIKFENRGPYDARVSVWTYEPQDPDKAPAPPGGGWVCRAPGAPLAVDRAVCRMLPVGKYSFCIEYKVDGGWQHYVMNWLGGLGDHAPNYCALATKIDFETNRANAEAGRCGVPPPAGSPSSTSPTPTSGPEAPEDTPTVPPQHPIQTEGEGVIITVKPGHPSSLLADGNSQTVLLIDVNPVAACWRGNDVFTGKFGIVPHATLVTASYPGTVYPQDLPAEVVVEAGATPGQAVVDITVSWCTMQGVMAFGVCTDEGSEDWKCSGRATIVVQ